MSSETQGHKVGVIWGIYCEESEAKFPKYSTFPKVKVKVGNIPHSKLNLLGEIGSFQLQGCGFN